jgi:hypothetical protein
MKKEYIYKEHKFIITVHLNYVVERRLNGRKEHRIAIFNDTDDINLFDVWCETDTLANSIQKAEETAKEYVDNKLNKPNTPEEIILTDLGFAY